MSWGRSRSWGFPPLMSYAEVAKWETLVKPIRGDKNGTKPLGDRRKKWNNINRDPDTQDIFINYASTEIARYKPDGDIIVNNGGWVSATTHDFIYNLLRLHIRTMDRKARVSCFYHHEANDSNPELMNISHEPKAVAGEFVMPNNRPVTFRMDPINQQWTTSDVLLPYTHKVNREKSNLVRKSYAKFKRYMSGIVKLRTEVREKTYWNGQNETERLVVITKEELAQYTNATRGRNQPFLRLIPACDDMAQNLRGMMLSDDPQLNYSAFLQIARSAYGYGYVPHGGFAVYVDAIFDAYNKILLFIHKHEVLERVQTEADSAKRDAYGAWFE